MHKQNYLCKQRTINANLDQFVHYQIKYFIIKFLMIHINSNIIIGGNL